GQIVDIASPETIGSPITRLIVKTINTIRAILVIISPLYDAFEKSVSGVTNFSLMIKQMFCMLLTDARMNPTGIIEYIIYIGISMAGDVLKLLLTPDTVCNE